MNWCIPTLGNRENARNLQKSRAPSRAVPTNSFLLSRSRSTRLLHLQARPAKGNPVPDEESEETMLKLLETFSESLIGDDAVLVRKTALAEEEAGRNLLREQDFLGL